MPISAPQRLGGGKPLVVEVDADQEAGILHARRRDHAEPERAGAGDHDDVLELDLAALDRVDRAGERLDEGGVLGRDGRRDLVVQRPGGEEHVLGHGAKGALAEAVDVVHLAHPVVTTPAIAAVPAGHDLLGDGAVADGEAVFRGRPLPQRDHLADEFVPGYHRRLAVAVAVAIAPEERRPLIAFEVAGADADRADLDDDLAGAGLGHRPFLETVVLRTMADDRLHGPGEMRVTVTGGHRGQLPSISVPASIGGEHFRAEEPPRRSPRRPAA